MAQHVSVHPDNPQQRLLGRAAEIVRQGGVIALPTDSSYALGCHLGDKAAVDGIFSSAAHVVSVEIMNQRLIPFALEPRSALAQVDEEAFGSCTNFGECEAVCPKGISIDFIARMNRDYVRALLRGE